MRFQTRVFTLVEQPLQRPVALERQLLHPVVFGRQIRVYNQLAADENYRALPGTGKRSLRCR